MKQHETASRSASTRRKNHRARVSILPRPAWWHLLLLANFLVASALAWKQQQQQCSLLLQSRNDGRHDTSWSLPARLLRLRAGAGGGGDSSSTTDDRFSSSSNNATTTVDGFTLLSDTVLHDQWRRLIRRRVRLPSGLVADFEIVGQSSRGGGDTTTTTDQAVLVFVWNTSRHTATLLREYMPATHTLMHGLAAGMVEAHKHHRGASRDEDDNEDDNNNNDDDEDEDNNNHDDSMQRTAAQHELEEECRLTGGRWIRLTDAPVTMDKYSTTRLTCYLVLDPVPVPADHRRQRDETEEGMEVVEGVTLDELRRMMTSSARMTAVGSWASLLALEKLREMGEIR